MNHFPETTAALRSLAREIADLFKIRDDVGETYFGVTGGIDRSSSPWWRVKDYEDTETGEK